MAKRRRPVRPEYPPLPDEMAQIIEGFYQHYLIRKFSGSSPINMRRSFENHCRRRLVVLTPDQVNRWRTENIQAAIDRGHADGIAPSTLYDELKAVRAFVDWQSDLAEKNGKSRWSDVTGGVVLPEQPARVTQEQEPKGIDLFLTVTKKEQRHLLRRADEIGGTRQDVLHLLIERDMKRDELLTESKLLSSNRKQVKAIIEEALDDPMVELRAIRALLEKLTGGSR